MVFCVHVCAGQKETDGLESVTGVTDGVSAMQALNPEQPELVLSIHSYSRLIEPNRSFFPGLEYLF